MLNKIRILREGIRIFTINFINRFKKREIEGDIEFISRSIISRCFKDYFMVSDGHFNQFYARDFGMCIDSLISLGYKKEVKKTLEYALNIYEKEDKITTHITPRGKAVDFPYYSPESLSYVVYCLARLQDKGLIKKYKDFILKKVGEVKNHIDKEGLLRKDMYYSSMKDHSKRKSSCYNNSMLGFLKINLEKIGFKTHMSDYDYEKLLKKYFWKKTHFIDDLSGSNIISGDANTYPYWTGVIKSKSMFKKSLKSIKKDVLDSPFALKYTKEKLKNHNIAGYLVPNYEGNTIWVHLGMNYLEVLEKFDEKELKRHLKIYEKLILKYKTFLEVYSCDGFPFKSLFYRSEKNMIWVSIFLKLYKNNMENE
ncbi:MAG: hypothetical protein ACMXX6_00645 [Candidatus Woesearchaeota archaeon]